MNYGDVANAQVSHVAERAPEQFRCGRKPVLCRHKPKKKRHAGACRPNRNNWVGP